MNEISDLQRRRAVNQIWNAAKDYHFSPDFKAFDSEGKAELYWNIVIGAVRRHYDYPKLAELLASFQQYEDAEVYEGLFWLGLENAVYQKEKADRPVVASLRKDYAERFVRAYGGRALDDYHLYDFLACAHYLRVLGREPRLPRADEELLDELEFTPEMDTDEIVARTKKLFARWFQITAEARSKSRKLPLAFLDSRNKKKAAGRLRRFGIGFADHPSWTYLPEEERNQEKDTRFSSLSAEELRQFMAGKYGASMFSPQQAMELERKLCTGSHAMCHLHFTKGAPSRDPIRNGFEALKKEMEKKQIEKNRQFYREHLAVNRIAAARLAARIQNSILLYLQPALVRSDSGLLDGGRVWRSVCLEDEKVFLRTEQGNVGDLSVDILLDASTSQANRQETVSSQGYLIAEAMNRCGIPCRVMSFCSMTGYTILRIFRDYGEQNENERIFEYVSNGCNRDGLAIRAAHELMRHSPFEHKILILLSDVKPHDAVRIATGEGEPVPYEKEAGIRDTAQEVRRAREDGIAVVCVFTGEERDLPAVKLIYGKDFARIPSVDLLADAVGNLLLHQIRNL